MPLDHDANQATPALERSFFVENVPTSPVLNSSGRAKFRFARGPAGGINLMNKFSVQVNRLSVQ